MVPVSRFREHTERLITWLESHAKTDLRYIVRGGSWLTAGNAVVSITAFVSSIAFAHFVPQHTFGVYQYVLATFGLLAIATLPKVNESMIRAVALGHEGEVWKAIRIRMRWGVLGGIAGGALATYYLYQGNIQLASAFAIVAVFVPFADPLGVFGDYMKAKKLFRQASTFRIFTRVTTLILTMGVIWYTQNLIHIVLAYFIIYTGLRGLSHVIAMHLYPPNDLQDPDAMRYGKSLSFLAAFRAGIAQLDKLLVFHYLGAVELAIYFFATAPVSQIQNALSALGELAFPKFSRNDEHETRRTLMGKIFRFQMLVLIPLFVGYIILIPFVFARAFPGYGDAVPLTQLFALSLLFFPSSLLSTMLVAHKKERALWISRTIAPFIRLGILIPSVALFGLQGMVLGVVTVSAIDFLINYIALYWPDRADARVA